MSFSSGISDATDGHGIAWGDFDGDGDWDFFVARSSSGIQDYLYSNDGDGTFSEIAVGRGIVESGQGDGAGWADIDGDGLKDIVTGKTYYSHHQKSPLWDAGAVVYWFRLVRTEKGVDWIPYRADMEAGIGRQLSVIDINGDTAEARTDYIWFGVNDEGDKLQVGSGGRYNFQLVRNPDRWRITELHVTLLLFPEGPAGQSQPAGASAGGNS